MPKNKGKQPQLSQASTEQLQELKTSLFKYNESFSTLLGLVPAKYYLQNEDNDGPAQPGKKLTKSQKKALKSGQDQAAKDLADAKRQAKKAKYDPNTPRTVIEIQQARAAAAAQAMEEDSEDQEEVGIALNGFKDAPSTSGAAEGDDDEDSPNESDFEDDEEDDVPQATKTQAKLPTRVPPAKSKSLVNGIASAAPITSGAAGEANRDALLEERRKQRGEMRERRRKEMKERKRKERESGVPSAKRKRDDEAGSMLQSTNKIDKPSAMSDVKKALKKEGRRQAPVPSADDDDDLGIPAAKASKPAAQPVVSAKSAVVPAASTSAAAAGPSSIAFSSLDFSLSSSINAVDAPKMSKKQRDGLSKSNKVGVTSHDPSVALNALNKRGEFLAKLTPQARERAEEKDKWERMAMRAEGTKVYDEEAKLKKMVKRKEKAKDKSRKDWADRKETIVNTQAAQQKKRQDNINARLQTRKDKKLGVKAKKSVGKPNPKKKGRPGFEGKGGGKK